MFQVVEKFWHVDNSKAIMCNNYLECLPVFENEHIDINNNLKCHVLIMYKFRKAKMILMPLVAIPPSKSLASNQKSNNRFDIFSWDQTRLPFPIWYIYSCCNYNLYTFSNSLLAM